MGLDTLVLGDLMVEKSIEGQKPDILKTARMNK